LHKDVPFSKYFDIASKCIDIRFYTPLWQYMPFIKSEIQFRNAVKILDDFAYDIIKKRRADKNSGEREDILSRYLNLKDDDGKPVECSDKYLRDVIMNLVIAGRDTTSQTLTWLFYLLSQNPRAEKALIEEIDSTIGESVPTLENVKNMKYLKACIDETLRLYPPVPNDSKKSQNSDVLPNGMVIRKGSVLIWSAWLMGRLEEYWDNPTEYRPERWLGDNGGKPIPTTNQPPFMPFQIGPRICLGMNMAYLEVKVLTCIILKKFHLQLQDGHNVRCKRALTMNTVSGMKMIPKLRCDIKSLNSM